MNSHEREQIAQWVEKHLDDSLTAEEFDQLQRMLTNEPKARELYLDLMHQHAHLQLERARLSAPRLTPSDSESGQPTGKPQATHRPLWRAALAASLLSVLWWNFQPQNSPRTTPVVARIVDSSDAQWGDCSLPTAVGTKLSRGHLKINRGLATIRFVSGAEVTLESPAKLEIQSPLAGRLLAGTAVVKVPDSAHGFTLATPTAVAIDHGTAFAVTVDTSSQTSSIEVLDGEVEVKHIVSNASLRLKEKQRAVASSKDLSESENSIGESKLFDTQTAMQERSTLHRITTADGNGRDASVSRSQDTTVTKNSHSELVLIKNPHDGYDRFSRKGYFQFDLSSLMGRKITTAKFGLTLRPSGLGFASKVNDCAFTVYGLTDEAGDNWPAGQLSWQNAPANRDGAAELDPARVKKLGRFVVRRGVQHGGFSIKGTELTRFLNSDTNQSVTLIVVRDTQETEPGGLVHGFNNQTSSVGIPPTLVLTANAE